MSYQVLSDDQAWTLADRMAEFKCRFFLSTQEEVKAVDFEEPLGTTPGSSSHGLLRLEILFIWFFPINLRPSHTVPWAALL